mgnify:FL=1
MAPVSISEAARLSGISRSNFYKKYIRQGKLSVTKDHQGRPQVDVSEIIRVFGGLHGDSNLMCPEIQEVTGSKHSEEIILEALNRSLEREQWYRQQIKELSGELSNARRLLEYQRPAPFWKKWFK